MPKCTGHKPDGTPCGAWAKRDWLDPPRCIAHPTEAQAREAAAKGDVGKVGAPKGNKNAQTHGAYAQDLKRDPAPDLQTLIDNLYARIDRVKRYIDARFDELEPTELKGLVALEGQLSSRLARLLKQKADQQAPGGDDLFSLIDEALEELWQQWEAKSGSTT